MKYVIISLRSGKIESEGPVLLIKANPLLNDTENIQSLPGSIHEESEGTQNFAFKISVDLIDTFIDALEESKRDRNFWNPNLADYELESMLDFDGNKISAYKHISLRYNQNPNPQEILPLHYKPIKTLIKQKRIINKKDISDFNAYLTSGVSSFDCLLNIYDNQKKTFAYPVLLSEGFSIVRDTSILSISHENGVFLTNDSIQPELNSPEYLRHTLLCCGFNRYYTSYAVKERLNITYRIFSKEANKLIFNLFNELAYPIPFDVNKLIKIYETNNWMGISERLYSEQKPKQVTEDDVIGFVSCEVKGSNGSTESILYMLTHDQIEYTRSNRYDLYDSSYQKVFLNSKYLKGYASKLVTWASIYYLQKKAGIQGDGLAINDENRCQTLLNYIHTNYSNMNDSEKDMCSYIVPDQYNLTSQQRVRELLVHNYIVNFGSIVRKNGLILAGIMPFQNELVIKQVDKIIEVIDKQKRVFLKQNHKFNFDGILDLIIINLCIQGPLKNITGLWAFYLLICLSKRDSNNLISELILLIYKNNQHLFMNLINQIKSKEMVEEREVKGWFRTQIIEDRQSWSSYDDLYCFFELFYDYSNCGKGYQLDRTEEDFFSRRLISELELDCIEDYFRKHPSINHTARNIAEQRTFYRTQLEKYVLDRINDDDYIFKDMAMQ